MSYTNPFVQTDEKEKRHQEEVRRNKAAIDRAEELTRNLTEEQQ